MADVPSGNANMNKKRNELKIVVYNAKNRKVEILYGVHCVMMLNRYSGIIPSKSAYSI